MTRASGENEPTPGAEEPSGAEPEPGAEEGVDSQAGEPDAGPARARRRPGAGAKLSEEELLRQLTALVFASPEPLSLDRLQQLLERPGRERVRAALEVLGQRLEAAGLPLEVRGLKGGMTLLTSADMGQVVQRLARGTGVERISPAALETLAVIAYRQPVTKAEVEAIRGVQAGPILRSLVDRGLVKVVGRAEVPGHPLQYGTTQVFLDRFGLLDLDQLPRDSELARD